MGKQWKQWWTLFSWAPKLLQMVTAVMKLKDTFSLEEKLLTNLDSILKSRDITLPTKVHLVKAMVFSSSHIWIWDLDHKESWALNNWCFEWWCWRKLFRVPWTARRSNQSILKEISPKYSLEGLMLKLQYSIVHRTWMLGASALGQPRGIVWGGRREEGSGWGTHVYLWRIHFDIWQN